MIMMRLSANRERLRRNTRNCVRHWLSTWTGRSRLRCPMTSRPSAFRLSSLPKWLRCSLICPNRKAMIPSARWKSTIRDSEAFFTAQLCPRLTVRPTLTVAEAHDYAQIFIDGKYIGKLDRRNGEKQLDIPACAEGAQLDILVEAMGRINFGRAIKDFKELPKRSN